MTDEAGSYYKVLEEVKRGKALVCGAAAHQGKGCELRGATVGCQVSSCRLTYHFPCALATGWAFRNSRRFFCAKHRHGDRDHEVFCVCGAVDDENDEVSQRLEAKSLRRGCGCAFKGASLRSQQTFLRALMARMRPSGEVHRVRQVRRLVPPDVRWSRRRPGRRHHRKLALPKLRGAHLRVTPYAPPRLLTPRVRQDQELYCVCQTPYEGFYLGCEACQGWFHPRCVGLSAAAAKRFDADAVFLCPDCSRGGGGRGRGSKGKGKAKGKAASSGGPTVTHHTALLAPGVPFAALFFCCHVSRLLMGVFASCARRRGRNRPWW
jgi:hypothetical protein